MDSKRSNFSAMLKLRMFGVMLYGPSNVMFDNQGVVKNTTLTQHTLGNKHNAVNSHVVCKADAAGIPRVGKEYMETNLDAMLKISSADNDVTSYSHLFYI